jgi:hypothetical protein
MHDNPYRTGKTWLTDDQLILLDILFNRGTSYRLLRREGFLDQWNLGYAHGLDDSELKCNLRWMCEHGILEPKRDGDRVWYQMTRAGGEIWSWERCPDWDRYCMEQYKTTSRGRTMMTVSCVSAKVRDDFLALWLLEAPRCRSITVSDWGLIRWHPFGTLYVGIATYEEQREWTPKDFFLWLKRNEAHAERLENGRSWWRFVPELQRFVPPNENHDS